MQTEDLANHLSKSFWTFLTSPNAVYGLFPRWPCNINPVDLWNCDCELTFLEVSLWIWAQSYKFQLYTTAVVQQFLLPCKTEFIHLPSFSPCIRPDPACWHRRSRARLPRGIFVLCFTFFSDFTGFRFSLRTVNSWGQIPPFDLRTATNEAVGPKLRYHDGRHDDSAVFHHRAVIGQGIFILDQNQFVDVIPVTNLRGKTNPNKKKG